MFCEIQWIAICYVLRNGLCYVLCAMGGGFYVKPLRYPLCDGSLYWVEVTRILHINESPYQHFTFVGIDYILDGCHFAYGLLFCSWDFPGWVFVFGGQDFYWLDTIFGGNLVVR